MHVLSRFVRLKSVLFNLLFVLDLPFLQFFFLSRTGLLQSCKSCSDVRLRGGHGQCLRCYENNKTGAADVKTVYMILVRMERWGPAAGCGVCGLVDSGRTRVKGLKK